MSYNYQDAKMESQQEYFGTIHTDNTKTLRNALERIKELEKENAELKERADKADLDSVLFFNQLCKAKEIIKNLMVFAEIDSREYEKEYKEAEEYIKKNNLEWELECHRTSPIGEVNQAFQKGAEFGYNKAMKEWRDCFMSCSSPYCADKFRDIQCGGILGNMTKEMRDGSVE